MTANAFDFDVEVVWFNPWAYAASGRGAIQDALLAQVAAKVLSRVQKNVQRATKLARKYTDGAMQAARFIPVGGELAADIAHGALASVPDSRKKLTKALKQSGRPLVVFIDDVDRLTSSELLELFAAMRVVVNLPHVQYVLAYDAESVARSLTNATGTDGHEFLEKIVAIPVPVPRVRFELLYRKFWRDLDAVLDGDSFDTKRLDGYSGQWLRACARVWLRTPRDLLRIVNRIKTMAPLAVQAELHTSDFIACEMLAVFAPDFSALLGANKTAALGLNDTIEVLGDKDRAERSADRVRLVFQSVLDTYSEGQRSAVLSALRTAVPLVHSALTAERLHLGGGGLRRLSHAAYFDRYFSYSAWADDVPDGEVGRRWGAVLAGETFSDAFSDLLDDGAQFVLRDKLIKAIDGTPPSNDNIVAIVQSLEALTNTSDWQAAVADASMFDDRSAFVDLDVVAAHAIRAAFDNPDDPAMLDAFRHTTVSDFAFFVAQGLLREYDLWDDDDAKASLRRDLASHVGKLLSTPKALDRYREHPDMLQRPARYAAIYAPGALEPAAWSKAIEDDSALLEVVLSVMDGVIGNDDPNSLGGYLDQFISRDVAWSVAQRPGPHGERVSYYRAFLDPATRQP
jgi:hypothetical protein